MADKLPPVQSRIIIHSETLKLHHEFFMRMPRAAAAKHIRQFLMDDKYPFFNMQTDDTEYIYPKEWMLRNCMIAVQDVEEVHDKGKDLDEVKKTGKIISMEEYRNPQGE